MRIIKQLILLICVSPYWLIAQNDIPVGTWRTHHSYNHVIDIALADSKVYAATKNAVFSVDQEDGSIQTITKLDGLSGGEITAIGYSSESSTLVIGYLDGNIDLIKNSIISTISTIKNDDFTNDKRINNIFIDRTLAYLATDFGVSIIELDQSIIKETAVGLGPDRIYETTVLGDSLYAASSSGILSILLSPTVNFLDFNNWKSTNSPSSLVINIIKSNGELFAAEAQGNLYQYNGNTWDITSPLVGEQFYNISASNTGIFAITESGNWAYENSLLTPLNIPDITPNKILQESNGTLWIADLNRGLVMSTSENGPVSITPSGPASDQSYRATWLQDKVLVVSGGLSDSDTPLDQNDGYYSFEDGLWESYNSYGTGIDIPELSDLTDVTYNPLLEQFVISSFGDGLLLVNQDHSSTVIDELTAGSTLLNGNISDVIYGNDGLWILNYGQSNSIHHWSDDDNWNSFALDNTATQFPLEIIITQNNDKWLRLSPEKGGGLYVFNEDNGVQRLLNNVANNGDLPSSRVFSIAEDHDGLIWVGTDRGVAYFAERIDDNNTVNAITPRIESVPLLRDETVLAITVDSGNRKWIGTENGVWLFDEKGEEEINYFNTSNSPLPSNKVISIAINDVSGEVLFCTDLGMVSYRGTATKAEATHQEIKVFPNPITRDFNGLVSLSGLPNNAVVKITDISGTLIRQMKSNGGTATWNVQDYRGNRASTGVYLVFSATEDGKDSLVGKLAVVN